MEALQLSDTFYVSDFFSFFSEIQPVANITTQRNPFMLTEDSDRDAVTSYLSKTKWNFTIVQLLICWRCILNFWQVFI